MKYKQRIYYTESQKSLKWDRWQKGDSLHAIARLFDRGHSSVQRILGETGRIRPPQRSRLRLTLTFSEREEISRSVVDGHSMRSIAESFSLRVNNEVNIATSHRHTVKVLKERLFETDFDGSLELKKQLPAGPGYKLAEAVADIFL